MNSRGQLFPLIVILGGAIILLLVAFFLALGGSIIKYSADEIIPELNSIGEIAPGVNVSEYSSTATGPVETMISNSGLLVGVLYIIGIIGLFTMAFVFRDSYGVWTIALFFVSCIFLIAVCILVSNTYEEFYTTNDVIGQELQSSYALVSWLILYSPAVMSVVSFIAGLILFTGGGRENVPF